MLGNEIVKSHPNQVKQVVQSTTNLPRRWTIGEWGCPCLPSVVDVRFHKNFNQK